MLLNDAGKIKEEGSNGQRKKGSVGENGNRIVFSEESDISLKSPIAPGEEQEQVLRYDNPIVKVSQNYNLQSLFLLIILIIIYHD